MDRKMIVILIILIAGVMMSLHSSFMGLHEQMSMLTNENEDLQNSLNTLPFIQVGRDYLDGLDKTSGKILSIQLEDKAPISWQNNTEMDNASVDEAGEILHPYVVGEPRLCWVIQFEQAQRPGHFFEVWIDLSTGNIIGMQECRANGRLMG